MRLQETFTYPDTDVESVYALITDPEFRERTAAATGAVDIDVTVEESGAGHAVTIVRTQPATMPDFVKKFVGDSVKIKQAEVWGGPDPDGHRSAEVRFTVIGQPAGMLGTVRLTGAATDVTFVIEGDVKVSVPFVGKKVEPEVAKAVAANVRHDVESGIVALRQ